MVFLFMQKFLSKQSHHKVLKYVKYKLSPHTQEDNKVWKNTENFQVCIFSYAYLTMASQPETIRNYE
jgi:hypothetical protein